MTTKRDIFPISSDFWEYNDVAEKTTVKIMISFFIKLVFHFYLADGMYIVALPLTKLYSGLLGLSPSPIVSLACLQNLPMAILKSAQKSWIAYDCTSFLKGIFT